MRLTAKQRLFVAEYMCDLNATRAAIRAGYSAKRAYAMGHENLKKPEVAAAIKKAIDAREKRTLVTADAVVTELAKIGFANMQDYLKEGFTLTDIQALSRDHAAAIQEVTINETVSGGDTITRNIKFKLADKRAALVDLGKHLGIFEANNKQKNPGDAIAAVIAEIQANSKRGLPSEDKVRAETGYC